MRALVLILTSVSFAFACGAPSSGAKGGTAIEPPTTATPPWPAQFVSTNDATKAGAASSNATEATAFDAASPAPGDVDVLVSDSDGGARSIDAGTRNIDAGARSTARPKVGR